jgi:hypothetical protein
MIKRTVYGRKSLWAVIDSLDVLNLMYKIERLPNNGEQYTVTIYLDSQEEEAQ